MNSPLGSRRIPNGTGFYERHRSDQNLTNDFLINREEQASGKSFTGIAGIRIQDCAVTETMGTIYNRSREHLGTTDAFIIRARRKLIAMAKAHEETGAVPAGVDDASVYRQRSGEMVLPRDKDFYEAYKEKREMFNAAPVKAFATVSNQAKFTQGPRATGASLFLSAIGQQRTVGSRALTVEAASR